MRRRKPFFPSCVNTPLPLQSGPSNPWYGKQPRVGVRGQLAWSPSCVSFPYWGSLWAPHRAIASNGDDDDDDFMMLTALDICREPLS